MSRVQVPQRFICTLRRSDSNFKPFHDVMAGISEVVERVEEHIDALLDAARDETVSDVAASACAETAQILIARLSLFFRTVVELMAAMNFAGSWKSFEEHIAEMHKLLDDADRLLDNAYPEDEPRVEEAA